MTPDLYRIWVYLAASPLLHLTITLLAYQVGYYLYRRSGFHPLANPVLFAVVVLVLLLRATGTDYQTYFDGAQFVHFLLGPATVALAIPLYRACDHVRRAAPSIVIALIVGSVTAITSAVAIAWALGASRTTLLSLAPKSVTTPVAMDIARQIGGQPSLTAVLVLLTGILGAVLGRGALDLLRVRDWRARGLAIGVAAHGLGAARAFQVNELAGAFASLGLGLNAIATSLLVPLLLRLF